MRKWYERPPPQSRAEKIKKLEDGLIAVAKEYGLLIQRPNWGQRLVSPVPILRKKWPLKYELLAQYNNGKTRGIFSISAVINDKKMEVDLKNSVWHFASIDFNSQGKASNAPDALEWLHSHMEREIKRADSMMSNFQEAARIHHNYG